MRLIPAFILGACILPSTLLAQQFHFGNTVHYLSKAKVTGRTTWNMNDTVQLISIDQYDGNGHKTEAYELYYGKRFLMKNTDKGWENRHDTTHYSFVYDQNGNQVKQIFHDFPNKTTDSYHMFKYDQYGNLERWETGRSFQLPHVQSYTYDQYGSVISEASCWADSCGTRSKNNEIWTTDLKHYLKYNSKQMVIEDLVNYMDGMSGHQYEYTFDVSGKLIKMKKYAVRSYFGLDSDIPTSKDIDQKSLSYEWTFEYNSKGELYKETRIDHWTESSFYNTVFIYNSKGLIAESLVNGNELSRFTYDDKGLLIEEKQYYQSNGEEKLRNTLKFEYAFK